MTSLAFMLVEVPEPVWKTSIGNWSSWRPWATSSAAAAMRSALSASSWPSSAFVRAAAALMRASQRTTEVGTVSPETGKLSIALRVSPPQSSWAEGSCASALTTGRLDDGRPGYWSQNRPPSGCTRGRRERWLV
jgi:hypothetical protein